MFTRIFATALVLLLARTPINAQQLTAEGAAGYGQLQITLPRPQHQLLTGMGMRLRQITDGCVYEQFGLPDQTGMVVDDLLAKLPANQAGIEWHDIIAKVDGKPVSSVDEFVSAYEGSDSEKVRVEIIQKGQRKIVQIDKAAVANRAQEKNYQIGVQVDPVSEELARHLQLSARGKVGLYVSGVVPDSPAELARLQEGDVLLAVNGTQLKSQDVLIGLIRRSQGQEITLELLRTGQDMKVKVVPQQLQLPDGEYGYVPFWEMGTSSGYLEIIGDGYGGAGFFPDSQQAAHIRFPAQQHAEGKEKTLDRLIEAVDRLTKEVSELRTELKANRDR